MLFAYIIRWAMNILFQSTEHIIFVTKKKKKIDIEYIDGYWNWWRITETPKITFNKINQLLDGLSHPSSQHQYHARVQRTLCMSVCVTCVCVCAILYTLQCWIWNDSENWINLYGFRSVQFEVSHAICKSVGSWNQSADVCTIVHVHCTWCRSNKLTNWTHNNDIHGKSFLNGQQLLCQVIIIG